jgi:hypothetical protein
LLLAALYVAERFADDLADTNEVVCAFDVAHEAENESDGMPARSAAIVSLALGEGNNLAMEAWEDLIDLTAGEARPARRAWGTQVVRCIWGPLPFRPVSPDDSWITAKGFLLARGMRRSRREARIMEPIPEPTLQAIEQNLHSVIRGRADRLLERYPVPLPSLAAMIAGDASVEPRGFRPAYGSTDVWFFQVPGMYGGFRLKWIAGGDKARLESISFCRVAGGSGQRHIITAEGSVLVESGMF